MKKVQNMQEQSADKIFYNDNYDLETLYRPVLEAIQYPYLLMDERLFELFEHVVCWMTVNKDKLDHYTFDFDHDYPGLFILLVSGKDEVGFLKSVTHVYHNKKAPGI